jgi:hypothetical protein
MFEAGQIDLLHKRLELIKSTGVRTGFATHVPEVVLLAEKENWNVDFYKTCLYNSRKTPEQRSRQSGFITANRVKHTVFYSDDKPLMLEAIKKVSKPCIAFKLFAGGQVFLNKDEAGMSAAAEKAIKDTFENIKPGDMTCVGVFQRDKNQIKENAEMAKKYC